jgi:hypothetical protein
MAPVLYYFKGSLLGMPVASLDSANGFLGPAVLGLRAGGSTEAEHRRPKELGAASSIPIFQLSVR